MMKLALVAFLMAHALAGDDVNTSTIPSELTKAFHSREKPKTGYLKYAYTRRMINQPTARYQCECRFSGDQVFISQICEPVQELYYDKNGNEKFVPHYQDLSMDLLFDKPAGVTWNRRDAETEAAIRPLPQSFPCWDPRFFGLYWAPLPNEKMIFEIAGAKGSTYIKKKIANLLRIECHIPGGDGGKAGALIWTLDSDQDYSVCQLEDEPSRSHAEIENKRIDGYWWPSQIRSKSEEGFCFSFDLQHAEFDRPDHPQKLDADLLNIPKGTIVGDFAVEITSPSDLNKRRRYYAGKGRLISADEWTKCESQVDRDRLEEWKRQNKRRAEEIQGGPIAEHEAIRSGWIKVSGSPASWDQFVRRWIEHHSNTPKSQLNNPLDDKQINAAFAILNDCKKQALLPAKRHEEEINRLTTVLQKAESEVSESAKQARRPAKGPSERITHEIDFRKSIEAQARLQMAQRSIPEIDEIYEQLKMRLDGLLTSMQRNREVENKGN